MMICSVTYLLGCFSEPKLYLELESGKYLIALNQNIIVPMQPRWPLLLADVRFGKEGWLDREQSNC